MNVTLGMVGLGRMGGNMSRRLARARPRVVAWDLAEAAREALAGEPGIPPVATLEATRGAIAAAADRLADAARRRAHGGDAAALVPLLAPGDVVVDGGNAHYRTASVMRDAAAQRLRFVDAGVSGGVWGLKTAMA